MSKFADKWFEKRGIDRNSLDYKIKGYENDIKSGKQLGEDTTQLEKTLARLKEQRKGIHG